VVVMEHHVVVIMRVIDILNDQVRIIDNWISFILFISFFLDACFKCMYLEFYL
jgi:Flp pilus assembly protein protease CpaA